MKLKAWQAIAVLLAVPVAAVSIAQIVVNDGVTTRQQTSGMGVGGIVRADTTFRLFTMDANGNVKTSESFPAFDQNGVAENVINNSGLAAAGADSNANPIDTHKWKVTGLFIKAVPSTGAGRVNRLAFQIRAHLNNQSDSSSVFAWYPSAVTSMATVTNVTDTLLWVGHQLTGSASAQWSGEFVVVVNGVRNAPANGVAATAFHYPSGIYIPLSNFFGTDYWAPYTSVRVRNLVGPTCAVTVHLIGTPL